MVYNINMHFIYLLIFLNIEQYFDIQMVDLFYIFRYKDGLVWVP